MRFLLYILLRSILLYALVYGLYRLIVTTARSFWEGLTGGRRPHNPPPPQPSAKKKIDYTDVRDASFTEDKR